jgi:hypothetical protein
LLSCKTESEKREEASQQAMERFEQLDTFSVDSYPQFKGCDEIDTTSHCFYKHLHQLITDRLTTDTLQVAIAKKDSLVATFTVSELGRIQYDSIAYCARHLDQQFMDSTLRRKLVNLPVIDSAIKQGVPVSSSYLVPVVVQPINQ